MSVCVWNVFSLVVLRGVSVSVCMCSPRPLCFVLLLSCVLFRLTDRRIEESYRVSCAKLVISV